MRDGSTVPGGIGGRIVTEALRVPPPNLLAPQKCGRDGASRQQAAATRPKEPAQMAGR